MDVMRSRNWRESGRAVADNCILAGAVGPGGDVCAAGGMEHDACLVDLETGAVAWQARNVRHDRLQLRAPVWVTGLAFGGAGAPGGGGGGGGQTLVAATAFKQLRVYDVRAETKRPVAELQEVAYPPRGGLPSSAARQRACLSTPSPFLHPP